MVKLAFRSAAIHHLKQPTAHSRSLSSGLGGGGGGGCLPVYYFEISILADWGPKLFLKVPSAPKTLILRGNARKKILSKT